jgi:hypothetical protein
MIPKQAAPTISQSNLFESSPGFFVLSASV